MCLTGPPFSCHVVFKAKLMLCGFGSWDSLKLKSGKNCFFFFWKICRFLKQNRFNFHGSMCCKILSSTKFKITLNHVGDIFR